MIGGVLAHHHTQAVATIPEQLLNLGTLGQIEAAINKLVQCLALEVLGTPVIGNQRRPGNGLVEGMEIANHSSSIRGAVWGRCHRNVVHAHHIKHQNRLVRDNRPPAFGYQGGGGGIVGLAGSQDGLNNGGGIVIQVIALGGVGRGLAAIVIDAQAAAQVKVLHVGTHFGQLDKHLGRFAGGLTMDTHG